MNQPSERARYLASYITQYQERFVHLLDDWGFYLDEDELAKLIQEGLDIEK